MTRRRQLPMSAAPRPCAALLRPTLWQHHNVGHFSNELRVARARRHPRIARVLTCVCHGVGVRHAPLEPWPAVCTIG